MPLSEVTPGIRINVAPAAKVGKVNESAGLPFSEKKPPVIEELLVFTNANRMPSEATSGFAVRAASMAALPEF